MLQRVPETPSTTTRSDAASGRTPERSHRLLVQCYVWLAHTLGRRIARLLLRPIVLYFLLFAPTARKGGMQFLQRVLPRPPGWRDAYRQIFCFASMMLDRVYLFGGHEKALDVRVHGAEQVRLHRDAGEGVIFITSHLGSFELMRAIGASRGDYRLRILMDRQAGAKVNAAVAAITGAEVEGLFIDTSTSDVDRILKVKAALERGEGVSLMADRYRAGERVTDCEFLGEDALFPLSPWLVAGMLEAPVFLAFGLYRGGNRYDLYFEPMADCHPEQRRERMDKARECAQRYADRLALHGRDAPYNWFNFYDFWKH